MGTIFRNLRLTLESGLETGNGPRVPQPQMFWLPAKPQGDEWRQIEPQPQNSKQYSSTCTTLGWCTVLPHYPSSPMRSPVQMQISAKLAAQNHTPYSFQSHATVCFCFANTELSLFHRRGVISIPTSTDLSPPQPCHFTADSSARPPARSFPRPSRAASEHLPIPQSATASRSASTHE